MHDTDHGPDHRLAQVQLARLPVETDASDVHADLQRGAQGSVLVDARSPLAFSARRIPGALSLPHRSISAETKAHLRKEDVVVLYCWGPGCNAPPALRAHPPRHPRGPAGAPCTPGQ